jgi:hypothetical protein
MGAWRREHGDRSVMMGAWRRERGDGSMEMGAWGRVCGDRSIGKFFLVVYWIFLSNDFISHVVMEEWECVIFCLVV